MTRLRSILAAAAAAVIAGATVLVGVRQSMDSAAPPMTCSEWTSLVEREGDSSQFETFYLGVTGGYSIPKAADGSSVGKGQRLLGDCAAGECIIKPTDCTATLKWTYKASPAVNGRRIVAVRAPKYIGGALRILSLVDAQVHWLGSFAEAVDLCLAKLPAADCRTMLGGVSDCWKRADGDLCRYGRLYGPGKGGDQTCTLQATDRPMPCEVSRGAGSELVDAARTFSEGDLE